MNSTRKELEQIYLGKWVHIIVTRGSHFLDTWGTVTAVDDRKRLHGSWGDFPVTIGTDYIGLND